MHSVSTSLLCFRLWFLRKVDKEYLYIERKKLTKQKKNIERKKIEKVIVKAVLKEVVKYNEFTSPLDLLSGFNEASFIF